MLSPLVPCEEARYKVLLLLYHYRYLNNTTLKTYHTRILLHIEFASSLTPNPPYIALKIDSLLTRNGGCGRLFRRGLTEAFTNIPKQQTRGYHVEMLEPSSLTKLRTQHHRTSLESRLIVLMSASIQWPWKQSLKTLQMLEDC